MLKLGIVKSSNSHSLSSLMHTAALQHLNIKGEYKVYEVSTENLKILFDELKQNGIKGLNVTIPHKISVIPLLDELTERANLIGAVNTITFNDGKSTGDNTDVTGFWEGIPLDIRNKLPGNNVVLLGYGGSACAIAIALIHNDVKSITVYGRDKKKLSMFKEFIDSKTKKLHRNVSTSINTLNDIDLSYAFMLINATPIGMAPDTDSSPVKKEDLKKLPNDSLVYDIIYKPQETKLLKDARSLKLKTLNGVEMLVRQGAASLNIWLGKEVAPINVMRLTVEQSLD